jgi:hypothetical protein
MTMYDEMERMYKKVVALYPKVLSQHFLGATDTKHEKLLSGYV